jgi:hypothetical protein
METILHNTLTIVAANRPGLHQPVGLPLVTNGPDDAFDNANDNINHQRGRSWSRRPV